MADETCRLLSYPNGQQYTELNNSSSVRIVNPKKASVSLLRLFSYSDGTDIFLIVLGIFGSLVFGFLQPTQFILMGNVTDDFVRFVQCRSNVNCTSQINLEESMTQVAIWYVGFAFAMLFTAWMTMRFWGLAAERQVYKIRMALFKNILYQEIGWFDHTSSGELSTNLTENLNKIVDGIGGKFGRLVSCVVTFIGGYIIGFIYCWQMTLVMMAVLPLMVICGVIVGLVTAGFAPEILSSYAKAGHVAEQSISSIRTVVAFGGERKQSERFNKYLKEARDYGVRQGFVTAIGFGAYQIFILANFGISFWFGIKMVRDLESTPGDVMTVFFTVIISSIVLGNAGPNLEAITTARGAAFEIFQLIEKESNINASSELGCRPEGLSGNIEFSNVVFHYPTRPSLQILKQFTLRIPEGWKVALVGESGCGKSTIIKLMQRFYDPQGGKVTIDGQDLRDMNVSWIRRHIGVVNQEPILFATTIAENIRVGYSDATQADVENAAKMANAHEFIMRFPKGYETTCGERGVKMSGGQKQRIAIARALVRDPSLLLLDEATSALDTESEAVVQEALDRAGRGRTTIIVAHRLSTVRDADLIVAMDDGKVVEAGTHDELMAYGGIYKALVKLQEWMADDKTECYNNENETDDVFISKSFETTTTGYETMTDIAKDENGVAPSVSFIRIFKMNKSEWHYIAIGCLGCALYGAYPFLFAICLAGIFDTLQNNPLIPEQNEDMKNESMEWAIIFLEIGVVSAFGIWLQTWMLAKAGEILTEKLRGKAFFAFLRQDISYFDDPQNSTGAICSKLCTEVSSVQGAVGSQFGLVISFIVTLGGSFVVAFYATWRLSLLMTLFLPLLFLAGALVRGFFGSETRKADDEEAGKVAMETFANIQTVASFGMQERFLKYYEDAMQSLLRKCKRATHIGGLAHGATVSILNLSFAAAFRYGGHLVHNGDLTLKEAMTAIWSIIISSVILGQIASLTPDYTKAKRAASRLFHLLDTVPKIDSYSEEGIKSKDVFGSLTLSNVRFKYPFRRNARILREMKVSVKAGQTVALVGTSGCGKSTCMSLVQRFYDVDSGHVSIDGNDVKQLNVQWLRRQIGLVSQEPVLFDLTIRKNIAFGENTREVSQEEIEAAAKTANIHNFIISLPMGYDTMVGEKGTLVSAGQKQRIAIARALIRDPKILLLDEATSALDSESEKVVQTALDKARIGRTTLVIAHRLSTIHNADSIAVLRHGKVVEYGNHQQLMMLKGIYFNFHQAQTKRDK